MFGLLNVNKPPGPTSRDVVNRVQWLLRQSGSKAKVGHAGTLDPIASGVLVLCLGPATRLIERVQQMEKRYVGTFRLGCTSPSDDIELEPTEIADAPIPLLAAIEAALPPFTGQIEQVPPAYSAVKIGGKKSYERVRRGEQVELKPRPVQIYGLEVVRYEYPELQLAIRCGSGTYIRSLGRDLAQSLGTGAVMSELVRTAIGPFALADGMPGKSIEPEMLQQHLRSPLEALPCHPRREITDIEEELLRRGMPIDGAIDGEEAAAVDQHGALVALLQPKQGQLWPSRVFVAG
ncbi:tRNA pseudouridine synthase B [Posidoniimonas polymericola]|uniref:tRNA pseudouridine synthase B n=1 Tax=Posidoniimonas polymericola TaxID=2528002 RepID=A0A5C5YFS1_9BACT|nr:tRNA pseudouridine(55) synthase TruB [Posidoniimonas polymericola]TWT74557.1 tRNA pseudouridine synthase B [Posidoniimonas polymericola]